MPGATGNRPVAKVNLSREPQLRRLEVVSSEREWRQTARLLRRYLPPEVKRPYLLVQLGLFGLLALLLGLYIYLQRGAETQLFQLCTYYEDDNFLTDRCLRQGELVHGRFLLAGSMLLTICFLIVFFYELYWRYFFRRLNYRSLAGRTFIYRIDERGFSVEERGRSLSLYRWRGVRQLINEKNFIFFFIDRNVAFYIPKRVFKHRRAAEDFYNRAKVYWSIK